MIILNGTYECKLDSKGRLPLPTPLKRQFGDVLPQKFIIKRSVYDSCLQIYSIEEWNQVMEKLGKLNRFIKQNNDFIRIFTAGLKEVEFDSTERLQISKDLIAFANLEKEVVVNSCINYLEIWDKNKYEESIKIKAADFENMASKLNFD